MNAAALTRRLPRNPNRRTARVEDLVPFWLGGSMIGTFTIAFCFITDGVAIISYQHFVVGDSSPAGWPAGVVVGFGVFAVAVSLVMGRWLCNLRRWIGMKGDPEDSDTIRRKRRSFVIGSMFSYLLLTPFVWAIIVAVANTANQGSGSLLSGILEL